MEVDRILTLEEVAELLRVSVRTVADWAVKGEIPGGKIGTSWRFKASEIDDWLSKKLSPRIKPDKPGYENLAPLIVPQRIELVENLNKSQCLNRMIDLFTGLPGIPRQELARGIFDREEIMSTGIGLSVAVPHCRLSGLKEVSLALAVSRTPIKDYLSFDGIPVRIIVMILAGRNQDTEYVKVLSLVSGALRQEAAREELLAAENKEDVLAVLAKY